ncbi:MAG: NAD-dependent epimerase/dehydratase family protein, partial [Candidatus Omnitrophica bacterium]|nr:NAD-dependent epimerase/dehydratase family protein [Candidatus Omnitrophota bacterium]
EGTRNLLECAKEEDIRRFIYISSLSVLGMKDHYKDNENAPYYKSGDSYIDTKIDAEKLVLEYHRNFNFPATIIRPGFVFGPRDKKLIPRILEKLDQNRFIFIGNGKNKIDVVYIDNLIDAILLAGKNPSCIGQIYNVTNDSGMALEDFIFKLTDIWHLKRPSKHVPRPVAYLVCNLLGTWATITKSKKPPYITKTKIKFLSLNLDFDVSKMRKELGYNPTVDIEEGLKRTKQWLAK